MAKPSRKNSRLETRLNVAGTPMFLLDSRRRVTFFNVGCEALTGWKADEVVGEVCEYATESQPEDVASLTGILCPPPEIFISPGTVTVPVYIPHRKSRAVAKMLHFFPLLNDSAQVDGVLGMVMPIEQPVHQKSTTPSRELHIELAALRNRLRQRYGINSFVCQSEPMIRVLEQVKLAQASKTGFLLCGEVGTGKEHLARLIHYESEFRSRAFVPLDCQSLPTSELKQALTRLLNGEADGESATLPLLQPGTLYLENVECLTRDLQQLIVDAFQKNSIDLRLSAGSAVSLRDALENESIRPDFYYLLTTLEIELPALRDRPGDLMPVAQSFLEHFNRGSERQVGGFSEDVRRKICEYNWPGNLGELQRVIKDARDVCGTELIEESDLPFRFRTGLDAQSVSPAAEPQSMPLKEYLENVERAQIYRTLEQCRFNKSKSAELLGITRARLYRRMESLGIEDRE